MTMSGAGARSVSGGGKKTPNACLRPLRPASRHSRNALREEPDTLVLQRPVHLQTTERWEALTDPKTRLALAQHEARQARQAAQEASRRLREAIREAHAAGITQTRIAQLLGTQKQNVHKIIRDNY